MLLAACLLTVWSGFAMARPPIDPQDPEADPPASGRLNRSESGHMSGSVPSPLKGFGPYQRMPSIDESPSIIVARRDRPYWQAGTLDPVLSNACRLGDFYSLPLNRMVVAFTGDPDSGEGGGALLVVPPLYRHLLVDRRHLAKAGETYFFYDTGEPECEVWIEGKVTPRKLGASGTSLPPVNRKAAQKKRLAEVKSWPALPRSGP